MAVDIDTLNASRRRTAEQQGRDVFQLDVIETWPACVVCGDAIRWSHPIPPKRPGLYRMCGCPPAVVWRCGLNGWERTP